MDLTLLKDGLIVMVIGMGTVYLFLTVMIWVMNLNNHVMKFINKFCPEEVPAEKKPVKKSCFEYSIKLEYFNEPKNILEELYKNISKIINK